MGIASFAPSTALEAVTGFPAWATIIIVGLVSTFYTTLGGMKAVVWTDVFQAIIMVAGLLAIVIEGVRRVGSMDTVWTLNDEWGRIKFFDFSVDPSQRHSFWSLVVGGMVTWVAVYGCNQASVQRYCALTSLHRAKISVLLNMIGLTFLVGITCLAGVIIFAYYVQKDCDPLTAKRIGNSNQIVPYFVLEVFDIPGLPGLFISCLFSGALSTMSSCLNSLAAVGWEDIFKPHLEHRLTESQRAGFTKLLVCVFGGAGIGMAFMAKNLGGTVLQASLSFTGAASGPVLGLFLLGGVFPWANAYGAVVGGLTGLALPLWISFGSYSLHRPSHYLPFPVNGCVPFNTSNTTPLTTTPLTTTAAAEELSGVDKLYTLTYLWFPSIGMATVIVVGLIVSFVTGPMKVDEIDAKYLIPVFDRLFCCLPESWRKPLRLGKVFPRPEDIEVDENVKELDVMPDPEKPPDDDVTIAAPISAVSDGKECITSPDSVPGSDVIGEGTPGHEVVNRGSRMSTHL